jgi:hypothetical protein
MHTNPPISSNLPRIMTEVIHLDELFMPKGVRISIVNVLYIHYLYW